MILPKKLFEKIEFFEHSIDQSCGPVEVSDKFILHFRDWWRRKKVIKINRIIEHYNADDGSFVHRSTPGAADLYNQLNDWAISTFEEKLTSISRKYKTHNNDNIIELNPKPANLDDE